MPAAESGPTGFSAFDNRKVVARQIQEFVLAEIGFQRSGL